MTFQRPDLLALAPLLALLFALALGLHLRRLRRIERAYGGSALRRLLPMRLDRFPTVRLLCLLGAGVAIGLAAAGPVRTAPEPPDPPPPLDLAVVVDLSLSMTARDVEPTRIARAREVVTRLTEELPSVRFSLVVFAGWPYTLLQPTDDLSVVRYFAGSMDVEVVEERDRGSSLSQTLSIARRTLEARPSEGGRQAVLLLSDGDVFEGERSVLDAVSEVAADGIQTWVGGLGTESGEALLVEGEPVFGARGEPVTVRRNTGLLRAIADAGGGRYADASQDDGLESLAADLRALSGDDLEGAPEPLDATFLLTLLAIPLLLWEGVVDAGRASTAARDAEERP